MVVRARRLAAELRRLREAAGLTLEEAGARLECSGSKVSRIETGQVRVSARDVRDLLRIYGVPGDQQASLIQLAREAREARQNGWWQAYRSTVEPHLATYLGLEHAASQIHIYRVSRIPALLQTPDYARSYFSAQRPGAIRPGTRQSMKLLTERQRQAAISPPGLQVVLGEAALRQLPGSPGILRAQLEHLTTLSTQPRTAIQVLPFTSRSLHLTIDGNFTIMGFPHPADPDLVCIGYPTGLLWIEDAAETSQYTTLFTRLQAAALPPGDSRTFMTSLLETL